MNEVAKLTPLIKLKSQLKVIEQGLYNKMLNQDNLKLKKLKKLLTHPCHP